MMNYRLLETSLSDKLGSSLNLSSLASKVLASKNKAVIKDFLDYQYQVPTFDMMDLAVKMIQESMSKNESILILGDYDADGILATSILKKTFEMLGYPHIHYYIPNRLSDGYGINVDQVGKAKLKGIDLIITVDNGINAVEAITKALELNIKVIISDHHKPNEEYIAGVAYIHPALSNLDYPISGGMVAYYMSCALLGYEDDYLLSLACVTTISDVMPIIKGNRKLVRKGLSIINKMHYPSIELLANGFIDSSMIGTIISPKINSLGRLPDYYNPNHLVEYFTTSNFSLLQSYALEIEEVNKQRKELSNAFYEKHKQDDFEEKVLFIHDNDLHEGVIGLLATRFSNEYNCITIIATDNDQEYKASLRSVDGINIFDIVDSNPSLFLRYGGHNMAMGLSFEKEKMDDILEAFNQHLHDIEIKAKSYDVIEIDASELSVDSVKDLRRLEPYGHSFEQGHFLLKDGIVCGIKKLSGGLHHKVDVLYKENHLEMMFFFSQDLDLMINDRIDVIVNVGINSFRNKESVSCIVENYDKK